MNRMKTTMTLMARWLVVLAAGLVVSSGSLFASAPAKAKSSCDASCAKRCPCCISKSAPANSPAPLAPASSTRTFVAKDFQLVPALYSLPSLDRESAPPISSHLSASNLSASVPIFVRHCAFLI